MGYHKLGISKSEMLKLREQGLSNKDIANVLDIHYATVVRYIGRQPEKMENMAAFKESAPTKPEAVPEEPEVNTPEIKRAVDEIVVRTERLSSKNGNIVADVNYVYNTVELDIGVLSFDELQDFAVFVVGMVERIKGVKK